MVVAPCKDSRAAILYGRRTQRCVQHYLGAGCISPTPATGGYGEVGDDGALALELHGDGAVLVLDDLVVEQRAGFQFRQFGGYYSVLHRIGAVGVEAVVHLGLIYCDADIPFRIRRFLFAVYGDTPDGVL